MVLLGNLYVLSLIHKKLKYLNSKNMKHRFLIEFLIIMISLLLGYYISQYILNKYKAWQDITNKKVTYESGISK